MKEPELVSGFAPTGILRLNGMRQEAGAEAVQAVPEIKRISCMDIPRYPLRNTS